jgi:hypothetical protein
LVFVLPFDDDVADPVLLALADADVQIDAVAFHQELHGVHVEGQVAIVHVQRADVASALVHVQAAVERGLVVHIAALDVQDVQQFGGVLGVAVK